MKTGARLPLNDRHTAASANGRLLALAATAILLFACWDAGPRIRNGVVNVNTADVQVLSLLPDVDRSLAERIVEFRRQNGAYETPAELILVRGIGEGCFELLRPYVVANGETTLAHKVRVPRTSRSAVGCR